MTSHKPTAHLFSIKTLTVTTHLFLILYEFVDFVLCLRNHEISIQNRLAGHNLFKAAFKVLNAVIQESVEPVPVFRTHQAVLENPAAFVVPQLQQLQFVLNLQW